jgi:hypothetical protein
LEHAFIVNDVQRSQIESSAPLSKEEIEANKDLLISLAPEFQLSNLRVDYDGTLVVHAYRPGYFSVMDYAEIIGARLGRRLLIATDDAPRQRNSATELQ